MLSNWDYHFYIVIKQWLLTHKFSKFKYSPQNRCFWQVGVLAKMAVFRNMQDSPDSPTFAKPFTKDSPDLPTFAKPFTEYLPDSPTFAKPFCELAKGEFGECYANFSNFASLANLANVG
jgi:hypothetical protein